jgi:hypothetical protein
VLAGLRQLKRPWPAIVCLRDGAAGNVDPFTRIDTSFRPQRVERQRRVVPSRTPLPTPASTLTEGRPLTRGKLGSKLIEARLVGPGHTPFADQIDFALDSCHPPHQVAQTFAILVHATAFEMEAKTVRSTMSPTFACAS